MKETLSRGELISIYITDRVGTINCFYIFTAITLISLPDVIMTWQAMPIVQWVATTFLQLVLLPLIMIAQNIQSKRSERLEKAIYEKEVAMNTKMNEILLILKNSKK